MKSCANATATTKKLEDREDRPARRARPHRRAADRSDQKRRQHAGHPQRADRTQRGRQERAGVSEARNQATNDEKSQRSGDDRRRTKARVRELRAEETATEASGERDED